MGCTCAETNTTGATSWSYRCEACTPEAETAPEPREDVADTCPHCGRHRPNGCLCRIPISRRYTEDEVAERVRAAVVEVIDEVQRVFDMQCPPSLPDTYVDRGAWMAHSWWNTVLGGTLRRLRDRADRRAER